MPLNVQSTHHLALLLSLKTIFWLSVSFPSSLAAGREVSRLLIKDFILVYTSASVSLANGSLPQETELFLVCRLQSFWAYEAESQTMGLSDSSRGGPCRPFLSSSLLVTFYLPKLISVVLWLWGNTEHTHADHWGAHSLTCTPSDGLFLLGYHLDATLQGFNRCCCFFREQNTDKCLS